MRDKYFGPSVKGITTTLNDIESWLNAQFPKGYRDFDGAWVDLPLNDEERIAFQRREQLMELSCLKEPVYSEWCFDMYFGHCCEGRTE